MHNVPNPWSALDQLMTNILLDLLQQTDSQFAVFHIPFQAGGDEGVSFTDDSVIVGTTNSKSDMFEPIEVVAVDDLGFTNYGFGVLSALSAIPDDTPLTTHLLTLTNAIAPKPFGHLIGSYYSDVVDPMDLLLSVIERVIGLASRCDFYTNGNWFKGDVYVDLVQRKMTFYIEDHYDDCMCITDAGVEGLELMDNTLVLWCDLETGDYGTAMQAAISSTSDQQLNEE